MGTVISFESTDEAALGICDVLFPKSVDLGPFPSADVFKHQRFPITRSLSSQRVLRTLCPPSEIIHGLKRFTGSAKSPIYFKVVCFRFLNLILSCDCFVLSGTIIS